MRTRRTRRISKFDIEPYTIAALILQHKDLRLWYTKHKKMEGLRWTRKVPFYLMKELEAL